MDLDTCFLNAICELLPAICCGPDTLCQRSKSEPSLGFTELLAHFMIGKVTQPNGLFPLFPLDVRRTLASCVTRVQRWRTVSIRSTSSPSTLERHSGSNSSQRRRGSKEVCQRRVRGAPRTLPWSGTWPAGQETLQYLHERQRER